MNKGTSAVLGLFILLLLSACAQTNFTEITEGFTEPSASIKEIPSEPSKETMMSDIKNSSSRDIEAIIAKNFYLLDVVQGDNGNANIYATQRFTISELVTVLSEAIQPDQISEMKNNQQILIYPNHFVTVKTSQEDANTLLIEVASDEFVKNNYSPNFLTTYFAIRLLDDVLDVDDWGKKRINQCSNGGCYGGYSIRGTTQRGMSDFRGGGPSAGK